MKTYAIVTGASSGIGYETAKELAAMGYSLLLIARRQERLEQLQTELLKNYPDNSYHLFTLDIQDSKMVAEWAQKNKSLLAKSKVLINNAGLAQGVDPMPTANTQDWDVMIDTNIKGLLYMTRALLPYFSEEPAGCYIFNIGSVAGRWVYPGGGVYCATKFATRALTEGLRLDLLGTGVRVTNIEPGMVHTEFSEVRLKNKPKADQIYQNMTPLSPVDIAQTVAWCLSRPAHVNIQELVVFPTDQAGVGFVHRQT